MFVALLALAAQYPAPPAPPPVITPMVRAPMPPPPIISVPSVSPPMIMPSRSMEPPVVVDVRVTAGDRTLFADQMRVDSMMGASFSQNRTEALGIVCTGPERYDRQLTTMFSLRLNSRSIDPGRRLMTVSVNWTRPIDGASCLSSGTRGATLNQSIALEPGKAMVLTGDGGLRVELKAR